MRQGLVARLSEPRPPSDHPCMKSSAECRGIENELVALRAESALRKTRGFGESDKYLLRLIQTRRNELYWHVCDSASEDRRTA